MGGRTGMAEDAEDLVRPAEVFAALRAFDPALPELTVAEVAGRAGLDRDTAFRLVHALVSLGYLRPVPGGRRFRLGLKCLELGFIALARRDLRAHAAPLLHERVPAVADAGLLGALDGPDVVHLVRVAAGPGRWGVSRRPGRRTPARGSALGLAQLAFLPEARQVAALAGAGRAEPSERAPTDLGVLLERLRRVRARGYAVSDGWNACGLRTVAAPVLDAGGAPIAGVGFAVDAGRTTLDEFVALAGPEVLHVAEQLTDAVRCSAGAIGVGSLCRGRG